MVEITWNLSWWHSFFQSRFWGQAQLQRDFGLQTWYHKEVQGTSRYGSWNLVHGVMFALFSSFSAQSRRVFSLRLYEAVLPHTWQRATFWCQTMHGILL